MRPIGDFADCLKAALVKAGMSASELSRKMHFSSRNSIFRVLNNEVSYEKQLSFYRKLRESGAMELSGPEWEMLERGLEVSRVGKSSYLTHAAVKELVMPSGAHSDSIQFVALDGEGRQGAAAAQDCLSRIFQGDDVRLLIVGCCVEALFREIGRLLGAAHRDGRTVAITHYIQASGEELVCAVSAIQPVIFDDCYCAYVPGSGRASEETRSLYRGNMILADYADADGSRRYLHLIMPDYGRFHCCAYSEGTAYAYIRQVFTAYAGQMIPLKSSFSDPSCPEDYLRYTLQYLELEKDVNLYDIKSDVPINYIHPDILLAPVQEGFAESGFGQEETRTQFIRSLYDIQLERWKNFFEKRKVTHTVFTYESMRRFALTGSQSDHFFAMRPYTAQERQTILQCLKEQTAKNPYFTIYFFRRDVEPVQSEIGMYEGKGVLLTKANTDYRLDGGHAEALITQPEFCAEFKDYFLKQILVHDVTSARETQAIMDELIALCRE